MQDTTVRDDVLKAKISGLKAAREQLLHSSADGSQCQGIPVLLGDAFGLPSVAPRLTQHGLVLLWHCHLLLTPRNIPQIGSGRHQPREWQPLFKPQHHLHSSVFNRIKTTGSVQHLYFFVTEILRARPTAMLFWQTWAVFFSCHPM